MLCLWIGVLSLFRASPIHGYQSVCAALTSPIIMISTWSKSGQDARDLAMFRIQMTVIGVLVFVTLENALWPKSTRRTVREGQTAVLRALGDGLLEVH